MVAGGPKHTSAAIATEHTQAASVLVDFGLFQVSPMKPLSRPNPISTPKDPILPLSPKLPTKAPTPVNIPRFHKLLQGYDPTKKDYLINGFTHGFKLDFDSESDIIPPSPEHSHYNHQSALLRHDMVSDKLHREVAAGRLAGPFQQPPLPDFQVSPLALVEKKKKGSYRLIHNLSYPEGSSVNDHIERAKGSVRYQRLDDAIDTILRLGPGCVLSKTDLEHAYKLIPVHMSDVAKLGLWWDHGYWVDLTLAMGCRTSARIFETFSTALEWVVKNKFSLRHIHHVLDDFLLISQPSELASKHLNIFLSVCAYLGIPVVLDKTESGISS